MHQIEGILNRASEVERIRGALGMSMTWTLGLRLCNNHARIQGLVSPGVLSDAQEDLLRSLEAEQEHLQEALAWAGLYIDPGFPPDVASILDLVTRDQGPLPEAEAPLIEAFAEEAGISLRDALQAIHTQQQLAAESQALTAGLLKADRRHLEKIIQRALEAEVQMGFELSPRLKEAIARKLGEKLAEHRARRLTWAITERNLQRRATLIADAKVLGNLATEASALAARLMGELESETSRSPIEEQAAAVEGY